MHGNEALEIKLVFLGKFVEIRLVLEEVRIELLISEREIRLNIVAELNDLETDAFLLELRFNESNDVCTRHGRHADGEHGGFFGIGLRCIGGLVPAAGKAHSKAGGNTNGSKQFGEFHF